MENTTPSFDDMERIHRFLRPMIEGGMGSGDAAWIAYCLQLTPARLKAALWALEAQGRIEKDGCERYRHTR